MNRDLRLFRGSMKSVNLLCGGILEGGMWRRWYGEVWVSTDKPWLGGPWCQEGCEGEKIEEEIRDNLACFIHHRTRRL